MKGFTSIDPMTLDKNWFEGLHSEWALLSAGKPENFNTMVIGWGMFGPMWGIPVCEVVVRPQRYTFEFIEREETYSVAFFGNGYRKELGICGSKSGRDIDKMKETGFTPIFEDGSAMRRPIWCSSAKSSTPRNSKRKSSSLPSCPPNGIRKTTSITSTTARSSAPIERNKPSRKKGGFPSRKWMGSLLRCGRSIRQAPDRYSSCPPR